MSSQVLPGYLESSNEEITARASPEQDQTKQAQDGRHHDRKPLTKSPPQVMNILSFDNLQQDGSPSCRCAAPGALGPTCVQARALSSLALPRGSLLSYVERILSLLINFPTSVTNPPVLCVCPWLHSCDKTENLRGLPCIWLGWGLRDSPVHLPIKGPFKKFVQLQKQNELENPSSAFYAGHKPNTLVCLPFPGDLIHFLRQKR